MKAIEWSLGIAVCVICTAIFFALSYKVNQPRELVCNGEVRLATTGMIDFHDGAYATYEPRARYFPTYGETCVVRKVTNGD